MWKSKRIQKERHIKRRRKKCIRKRGCKRSDVDHPTDDSWPSMLLTASLLPLEPTLKRNQPLCLACKCLTINQHHKTQSGSRRDAPSLSLSSYFSQVPSISPLPNPPLFIFPQLLLGGGGCWAYATVPLPFPFSPICPSALWQPSIRRWRHGDGAPREAFIRPAGALWALPANRAALTSPTPRQRRGSKD